jgi:hypothetical protein
MNQIFGNIVAFFDTPFFVIAGGISTVVTLVAILYGVYLFARGVIPVWLRLGMGLSKRKIAVFADKEFDDLVNILVDSGIFRKSNVLKITKGAIKKAEDITLYLVHWKCFNDKLDEILAIKRDATALLVYAPQDEGKIDQESLGKINAERNSLVINFRGRLLNDVLACMITTSYKRK